MACSIEVLRAARPRRRPGPGRPSTPCTPTGLARSRVAALKRNRRAAFDEPGSDYHRERLRVDVSHRRVQTGWQRSCVLCGGFELYSDGSARKKRRRVGHVSTVACSFCPGQVHLCDTEERPCFRLFHACSLLPDRKALYPRSR